MLTLRDPLLSSQIVTAEAGARGEVRPYGQIAGNLAPLDSGSRARVHPGLDFAERLWLNSERLLFSTASPL